MLSINCFDSAADTVICTLLLLLLDRFVLCSTKATSSIRPRVKVLVLYLSNVQPPPPQQFIAPVHSGAHCQRERGEKLKQLHLSEKEELKINYDDDITIHVTICFFILFTKKITPSSK